MNKELVEVATEITKSTLREQDGRIRVMLESGPMGEKACLFMFTQLLPPILSMYKCGLMSLTPLWELAPEVQGLKLTPHGWKLAIKAVRSIRRGLVDTPDYFPPDILEYTERLYKKYETELV